MKRLKINNLYTTSSIVRKYDTHTQSITYTLTLIHQYSPQNTYVFRLTYCERSSNGQCHLSGAPEQRPIALLHKEPFSSCFPRSFPQFFPRSLPKVSNTVPSHHRCGGDRRTLRLARQDMSTLQEPLTSRTMKEIHHLHPTPPPFIHHHHLVKGSPRQCVQLNRYQLHTVTLAFPPSTNWTRAIRTTRSNPETVTPKQQSKKLQGTQRNQTYPDANATHYNQ